MTRLMCIVWLILFQGAVNPRSADNALDGQFARWSVANNRLQWGYDTAAQGATNGFDRRYGVIYNAGITGLVATPEAYGDTASYDCASLVGSAVNSTATEPQALHFQAGTSVGCVHGATMWLAGKNLHYQTYTAFTIGTTTTTFRIWFGLSDQTATTMAGADDPAGNYAGLLYSAGGGSADDTFKCVSKDNVTQQLTDSMVTVQAYNKVEATRVGHKVDIVENPGVDYRFYIDDVLVCTHATNYPASGTLMAQMWTAKRAGGTPVDEYPTWGWVEADNK